MKTKLLLILVATASLLALFFGTQSTASAQAEMFTIHVDAYNGEDNKNTFLSWGKITSSPAGIDCSIKTRKCDAAFTPGSKVVLTGVPMNGDISFQWGERGPYQSPYISPCQEANSSSIYIGNTCTFTIPNYDSSPNHDMYMHVGAFYNKTRITLSKTGTGSGVVTSDPAGLNCGTVCVANYPTQQYDVFARSSSVKLIAKADPGSVFAGWSNPKKAANVKCEIEKTRVCTAYIAGTQSAAIAIFNKIGGTTSTTSKEAPTDTQTIDSSYNEADAPRVSTLDSVNTSSTQDRFIPWLIAALILVLGLAYLYVLKFRRHLLPAVLGGKQAQKIASTSKAKKSRSSTATSKFKARRK